MSQTEKQQQLTDLEAQKGAAVAAEDYETASRLKAQIESLRTEVANAAATKATADEIAALRVQKDVAVAAEQYDTAAQLKAQIQVLEVGLSTAAAAAEATVAGQLKPARPPPVHESETLASETLVEQRRRLKKQNEVTALQGDKELHHAEDSVLRSDGQQPTQAKAEQAAATQSELVSQREAETHERIAEQEALSGQREEQATLRHSRHRQARERWEIERQDTKVNPLAVAKTPEAVTGDGGDGQLSQALLGEQQKQVHLKRISRSHVLIATVVVAILVLLAHVLHTNDPCDGVSCDAKQSCSDGSCVCKGGHAGDQCQVRLFPCHDCPR